LLVLLQSHDLPVAATESSSRDNDIQAEILSEIRGQFVLDDATRPLTASERTDLERLYSGTGRVPLWIEAGQPDANARQAIELLDGAEADGLNPSEYGIVGLLGGEAALKTSSPSRVEDIVAFDVRLSAGMLRYLHDVHRGRVDPRRLGLRLSLPADTTDFVWRLQNAIERGRIKEMAAHMPPPLMQYRSLRAALARYRSLAGDEGLTVPVTPVNPVRPGERAQGVREIHRLLTALGDIADDTPGPTGDLYDGALVDGIRRFQLRHGLEPDGVIGQSTRGALSFPIGGRVRQIELALERLRWLPEMRGKRIAILNIPMFYLWGWNGNALDGAPSMGMRTIVGRAARTQTPVLNKQMEGIIFRPYWNIPSSILRSEILPTVERDRAFLLRENMEIVRGTSDDAPAVELSEENLAQLARGQGQLRLRQRPGPRNALGLIKFVLPNEEHVYLHDTPGKALFARPRRDFSHGCVRVADPVALAEWALEEEQDWHRDRILAAAEDSLHVSHYVRLTRPIGVVLFYATAFVDPNDGAIHFAEDIYGHDATLERALAK
jgi:murein L,D-transpeptidase YcbB/YkuD